jgi:hypothetical protein
VKTRNRILRTIKNGPVILAGLFFAVEVHEADKGDTSTLQKTLEAAQESLRRVTSTPPCPDDPAELVADKGYFSRDVLKDLDGGPWRTRIDEQFLETPFYGSRQMQRHLRHQGLEIGRGRVRRLMRKMGVMAIYQKPKPSQPHPGHKIYLCLLRGLAI